MMLCQVNKCGAWHNPNSLCHKVFKARFNPDYSILEAKESTLGSYTWKSTLSVSDVIKKGMVWRVENGQSVCIREDKWLQDKICRTVITPLPFLPPDAKVSALIDAKSITQKVDQVQKLFLPHEAKFILSIPLSTRLPPNRLIWSQTPMGVFTTRSAYQLLANAALANSASSSNLNPQKKFWNGLWKLQVPNKVKLFAWRPCNKALPTTDNLFQCHITELLLRTHCMLFGVVPGQRRCGVTMFGSAKQSPLHRLNF